MSIELLDVFISVFTILSLLTNLIIIACFIYTPKLREGFYQLILAQCISQFVFDLHWLTVFVERPSWECEFLGFFGVMSYLCAYNYAAALIAALYLMRYHEKLNNVWIYHAVSITLSIILSLLISASGCAGGSVMGTCYILKGSNSEILTMVVMVLYTTSFSPWGVYMYFNFVSESKERVKLNVLVVLCYFATMMGSALVHFMAWRAIDAHIPLGLMAFAQISGALSGFITGVIRLMNNFVRDAVWKEWTSKSRDSMISHSSEEAPKEWKALSEIEDPIN